MTKVPSRIAPDAPPPRRTRTDAGTRAASNLGSARSKASASGASLDSSGPRAKERAGGVDGLLELLGRDVSADAGAKAKGRTTKQPDGFELNRANAAGLAKLAQVRSQREPVLKPRASAGTALAALNEAKPPGVYFREDENGGEAEDEDPELAAAVEEAIQLLFGVPGIHHIGPGVNDKDEPVVVIAAARGFSESSLARIPEKVHRFPTLLVLPFELLPLRRT